MTDDRSLAAALVQQGAIDSTTNARRLIRRGAIQHAPNYDAPWKKVVDPGAELVPQPNCKFSIMLRDGRFGWREIQFVGSRLVGRQEIKP